MKDRTILKRAGRHSLAWGFIWAFFVYGPAFSFLEHMLPGPTVVARARLFQSAARASLKSSDTTESTDSIRSLEIRKPLEQEIAPSQTHAYQITLKPGQYLRIAIECREIGIRGQVYGPNDQTLLEFECQPGEPTPVSLIADVSGSYRLVARARENDSVSGRYEVKIEDLRRATRRDRNRILAERAFHEAGKLKTVWQIESSREAIQKYEEARDYWRTAGDRRAEAYALRSIGQVYQSLDESHKALTYYTQALVLNRSLGDPRVENDIHNDIGYLYAEIGDNQKALEHASSALRLSRATGNSLGEARALNTIGDAYYGFGDLQKTLEYYQQALQLSRQLNDRRGQIRALVSFGYAYVDLSEIPKARESYQEALSLSRSVNDRHWEAVTLRALGNLQTKLAENQQALDSFLQGIGILQTLEDQHLKATVLGGLGYAYDGVGEKRRALEYYNQALAIFKTINHRWGEAEAELYIGGIHYSLGEHQAALNHYLLALSSFRTLGMTRYEAQTLRDMGLVYGALGDKNKALDCYQRSLALTRAGQDQRYEAYTLNYIGRVYEDSGEKQKALNYYQQSLPLNHVAVDPAGEALTLYNIAHVERDLGNLIEARARIEAALKIAESLRTRVVSEDLRATYFASAHQHYELYIDVLMQLHKEHPTEEFDVAAFNTSERARARALLETLEEAHADIREGVDPVLLERERSLQQALNAKAERQMQLFRGQHNEEEAASLAKEIDRITTEYDEVKAQIKATSPHYAALTQPQPLRLNEIQQQVLDDKTLLLEYTLGDERSYLWAVTRTSLNGYELPGRVEIEEASRRVCDLLKAHQPAPGETLAERQERASRADAQYWHEAAALSRMILGPVAGQLGNKQLLIVADGALQYIPFGALTMSEAAPEGDAHDAQANETAHGRAPIPLIVNHEIVTLPSASTLAVLRRETAQRAPAPRDVAVLADPVFEKDDPRIPAPFRAEASAAAAEQREGEEQIEVAELSRAVRDAGALGDGGSIPRLLASREEAEAIMQVTPTGAGLKAIGFDASRATATSPELSQYRIVHFATHGLLNSEHPELSGVILSLVDQKGQPQNGFLRLHDIYNLNLPVDLVVLSACNTGLGKDVKGEGLIGLTRGFMYAGASGVMASLWKVDDEATAELMKQFYRGMLKDGLPAAAALRQAQIMMWQQKPWRSPYYWAAFVLQGEYRERIDTGDQAHASAGRIVAAGVVVVLIFSIGGGLHARQRRQRRNRTQAGTI